jgi:hypothetical protein
VARIGGLSSFYNCLAVNTDTVTSHAGLQLVVVAEPADGSAWTAALLRHIGPQTVAVAVPGCHWCSGHTIDLVDVGAACRAFGAFLAVDGTQSIGAARGFSHPPFGFSHRTLLFCTPKISREAQRANKYSPADSVLG